jgi:hypothetical protein
MKAEVLPMGALYLLKNQKIEIMRTRSPFHPRTAWALKKQRPTPKLSLVQQWDGVKKEELEVE